MKYTRHKSGTTPFYVKMLNRPPTMDEIYASQEWYDVVLLYMLGKLLTISKLTDRWWSVIFTHVTLASTWHRMTMLGPSQRVFTTEKTDHLCGQFYTLNMTNLSKLTTRVARL